MFLFHVASFASGCRAQVAEQFPLIESSRDLNFGPSRLYMDSAGFGLNPRENRGKSRRNFGFFFRFFKVFQAQKLRKYPRRSCGSFWSGLELRRPKFDRFRHFFSIFFHFVDPKNMKIQLFPFIFKRTGPETMLRS